MKASIASSLILCALCAFAPLRLSAQSSTPAPATPSPDPFHIVRPAPGPTPTPTLASKQAAYRLQITQASQMAFVQLKGGYLSILKLATSDDSASGGLTPQQKVAALTPEQQAWLEANARAIATLLNTIHPATVPEPPAQ